MLRIYFSFIISVFIFLTGSNQVFSEEYSHDAVYHELKKEYTLNEDGSIEFHYYKKLELKTHHAFHQKYGETFIVYNPKYQDLTINKSITTMADGTEVPAPDNAFNEVLPRQAKNAPAYNHLREMVVTHTGLQKGAVIELDYTITSKAGFYPLLMNREILSKEIPVKKMEIIANIPKGATLNHQTIGLRTSPETSEKDNRKQFTWKFSNLKTHPSEPYSPETYQFLPMLEFSTGNIAKEMASLNKKVKEDSKNFQSQMKEVERNIEELAGASNKTEHIYSLYNFIKENINHYKIDPEYYTFKPRPADKVLQSNGATNLEACQLLAKMLQYLDIEAQVVYVFSHHISFNEKNLLAPEFPMVHIEHGKENLFLNPFYSLDKNPLMYNENLSAYFMEGERAGKIIPVKKFRDNNFTLSMELKLDEKDNISGKATVKLSGACNPRLNFTLNQKKALKELENQLGLEFSDANVDSELSQTTIEANVDAGKLSDMADLKSFSLEKFRLKTQEINLSLISEKRKNPLALDFPFTETLDIILDVSGNKESARKEKIEHTHKNKYGFFQCEINSKRNKINVDRKLTIDKKQSSEDFNYQSMKNMMLNSRKQKYNQILFK
ncbi:MAG: DUF3857 domain-containing protein [Bacteroidales bacterium]